MREPEHIRRAREAARKHRSGKATGGKPADPADEYPPDQRGDAYEGQAPSPSPSDPPFPAPIPLNEAPDVSMFPADVLPDAIRQFAEEGRAALNVPIDFFGLPMLAAAGAVIGNSRHIAVKESHTEPPAIYAIITAPPGYLKTPALRKVRKPLDDIQREKTRAWQAKIDAWDAADKESRGPQPVCERIIVENITVETLCRTLYENPRGVALIRDEASGLVASLNEYKNGKGADKQFYLSAWSGDPLYVDRKSDKNSRGGPLHVYQPFVGIIGGIQPEILPAIAGETRRGRRHAQDGFIDRFAIAWPDLMPHVGEQGLDISAEAIRAWDDCIRGLHALEMVPEGEYQRPYFVKLNQSGREEWQRFTDRHAEEMNAPSFPPHLIGPWSKLRGMTARFALILHLMRSVDSVNSVNARQGKGMVDGMAVRDAARVTAYLKDHAKKVHACMGTDPRIADARRVLQWVITNKLQRFTKRDVHRQFPTLLTSTDEIDAILDILEKHYAIIPVENNQRGPGRKASPSYLVNPRILSEE
jgi:hypothetical protein